MYERCSRVDKQEQANGRPPTNVDLASFERLVRVESKLDGVIDSKVTDRAEVMKELADHEARIRSLERMWFKTTGVAAAISAIIAIVLPLVLKMVDASAGG